MYAVAGGARALRPNTPDHRKTITAPPHLGVAGIWRLQLPYVVNSWLVVPTAGMPLLVCHRRGYRNEGMATS